MINNQKISGLIGLAARAGKVTFGTEACQTSIQKKKAKLLIIATDAAERTKKNFNDICQKYNVKIMEILNTEQLSKIIGKENKVVISINDVNFSKEICKIVNGGEIIG